MINPLLQLPWMHVSCFRPDWLHVADLGVAADYVGNCLYLLQQRVPGRSIAARVEALWHMLQDWYQRNGIVDRLDSLTPSLFAPDSQTKGFKLRTSAARVRAIIPWVHEASQILLSPLDPVQGAARAASECLFKLYETLRESSFNHVSVACDQSTRFALLYLALHDHLNPDNNRAFRLKPKMHMCLHMCSDGSRPARFWCYRDEEFGGAVAGRARRRGGMRSVSATSRNVSERFWMQHPAFAMR